MDSTNIRIRFEETRVEVVTTEILKFLDILNSSPSVKEYKVCTSLGVMKPRHYNVQSTDYPKWVEKFSHED